MRDSFLTVQAVCSQLEMCMTASLPCRLCARGLCRNDVRDSFQTVQAMCSKFAQERRAGQFPYRAVCVLEIYTRKIRVKNSLLCSKFTQLKSLIMSLAWRSFHKREVRDKFLAVQAM